MTYTTFLFGNGLGRAVDNDYFCLEQGIRTTWSKDIWQLSDDDRKAILECLPGNPTEMQVGEENLSILHEISQSCELISSALFKSDLILTETGRRLPKSVNRFISEVGWYFHEYHLEDDLLFNNFVDRLIGYTDKKSFHIATLNYDNLLYHALIRKNVLASLDGKLIDGFMRNGGSDLIFDDQNFSQRDHGYGFYLHLHGSPLFISDNSRVRKQQASGPKSSGARPHMVLHHVNQKTAVIHSSEILNSYWKRFDQVLSRSSSLVLFGYGGLDTHVNKMISSRANDKSFDPVKISIIEWAGEALRDDRIAFWRQRLNVSNFNLYHETNILEFEFEKLSGSDVEQHPS